jgi:peroxiredoxin
MHGNVHKVTEQEGRGHMKKVFVAAALILLLASAVSLLRDPQGELVLALRTGDMFVALDDDGFDPGPAVGSHFPGLQAMHRGERVTMLHNLDRANGIMLVASRSIDWCAYCMRQLIQLQQQKYGFDASGIGLALITYDSPQQQQAFADKHDISIPLLSDIDKLSFKTLGILNEDYQPGDPEYGIPHPGMIVVDRDGRIAGKIFIEEFSKRIDSRAALVFAREVLGLSAPF